MGIINIKNIIAEEITKLFEESYDDVTSDVGEASVHVLEAISAAVYDSLEEVGADAAKVEAIMEHLHKEYLLKAVETGMSDYVRKLDMVGGKPKPPQISEGLVE